MAPDVAEAGRVHWSRVERHGIAVQSDRGADGQVIQKRVGWYDGGDIQREGVSEWKRTEAGKLVKTTDKWDDEDAHEYDLARDQKCPAIV